MGLGFKENSMTGNSRKSLLLIVNGVGKKEPMPILSALVIPFWCEHFEITLETT
jgi:hypothetical protein